MFAGLAAAYILRDEHDTGTEPNPIGILAGGTRSRWSSRIASSTRTEPFATGPMEPPDPAERGFKDTTEANPGYFTTVRARFDLSAGVTAPQTHVYHCHIVEHEDNDMMLPFIIEP